MSLANYTFVPWLRQGLSSKINEKDTLGNSNGSTNERATISVTLKVTADPLEAGNEIVNDVQKNIDIYGPGDVLGINPRVIVRMEPKPNVNNFEDNYLPFIEFFEEDFPWRYTPATANQANKKRLRPWLALIALKEEEFSFTRETEGLSFITLEGGAANEALPNEKETWAWAHVQLTGSLTNTGGSALNNEINNQLDSNPNSGIARLICPRKLHKDTKYYVFLIPAFETGRLAGLGEDTSSVKAQRPSWKKGSMPEAKPRPLDFPIYHQWNFRTGTLGDFETLVSTLKPIVTEADAGEMPMDIQTPGFGLDGMAESETVNFEAALKPPGYCSPAWALENDGDRDLKEELRKILNLSVDVTDGGTDGNDARTFPNPFYNAPIQDDPIITPPIYGYWHALIKKMGASDNPYWVETLNLDPRYRGASGIGTAVIQDKQEKLMNEAWKQVEDVNAANKIIREAELAKWLAKAMYKKHLLQMAEDRFMSITSPAYKLILNADSSIRQTIYKQFKDSRVPDAVQTAAFRRITRPGKKNIRELNQLADGVTSKNPIHHNLISKLNASDIEVAGIKAPPLNTIPLDTAQNAIESALHLYQADDILMSKEVFQNLILTNNLDNAPLGDIKDQLLVALDNMPGLRPGVIERTQDLVNAMQRYDHNPANDAITMEMGDVHYENTFGFGSNAKSFDRILVQRANPRTENKAVSPVVTLEQIQAFEVGFQELHVAMDSLQSPVLAPMIGNLTTVKDTVRMRLQPHLTLKAKLGVKIQVLIDGLNQPLNEIKPIMAHPVFSEPVYEYLKEISQNFILPNVEELPENSITLLENNQKFIESFMVGLNHEMGRELLWREYPTDQRGSYFRQFWDAKDNVLQADPELKLDITKIHTWIRERVSDLEQLGTHRPSGDGDLLVLVVRGELLEKFPNTLIYAQEAVYNASDPSEPRELPRDGDGNVMIDHHVKYPIFSAELEPDITLFGFDLTEDEARGDRVSNISTDTSGMHPGWFFVFRERPGQTRLGLDVFTDDLGNLATPSGNPDTWNDFSWQHLANNNTLNGTFHLNFQASFSQASPPAGEPNPDWGNNSADVASILYQNPVIFARHAAELLPEGSASPC